MKKILQSLFLTGFLLGATHTVHATLVTPQQEPQLFVSQQSFTFGEQYGWGFSNNMAEYVSFEDDKLYIEGLCGSNWAVGDLSPELYCATFESGQEVDEGTFIYASYKNGSNEIPLDTFVFDFSADRSRLLLRDYDGHPVILTLKYASGFQGMKWQNIELNKWTLDAPAPPADGEVKHFMMEYTNEYGIEGSKPVKWISSGNDVWLQDIITPAYLKGEIQEDGNIYFESPQYQGVFNRYLVYAMATMFDNEMSYFNLIKNNDGSYSLEQHIELRTNDDFVGIKSARLVPTTVYTGAPLAPTNVEWNGDFEHFLNFTLPMKGTDNEPLLPEWTYWQILVNGEPYAFTFEVYNNFDMYNNPDMFVATQQMQAYLNGDFAPWGAMGMNDYRAYLPEFNVGDNVAVRCGYKVDDTITWSDATLVAGTTEQTPLPAEAIYSTSVSIDAGAYGIHYTQGMAMKAEYGDSSMRLYNFFGDGSWVEGAFSDDSHSVAEFASHQVVSSNAYGKITLVAATLEKAATADEPAKYTPLDSFKLQVAPGGETVRLTDKNVYLLEVQGDGFVSAVWCPDFKLSIVTDRMAEVPEGATIAHYKYTSKQEPEPIKASVAQLGSNVWIQGIFKNNAWLAGEIEGDNIVVNLPQFVGVSANQITYAFGATSSPVSIVFSRQADGSFSCDSQDIWAGTSYPEWIAGSEMTFVLDTDQIETIISESNVKFENGAFVADGNVTVYTLSGMRVPNSSLSAGCYIVCVDGKSFKVAVK